MTWTILELLKWSEDYLKKVNIPKSRIDAEVLLASVLNKKRLDLYVEFERLLSKDELAKFKLLIQRRARHEPIQYILGEQEFWSLKFKVGPGVLIPRPETECLVEQAIACLSSPGAAKLPSPGATKLSSPGLTGGSNSKESPWQILDIGTGSGVLSVVLAKEFPKASITSVDISTKALEYAQFNAKQHGVEAQIQFINESLFLSLAESQKFDLIVSNPPYITTEQWGGLEDQIKNFEPKEALISGQEGVDILKEIIKKAVSFLKPKGTLILECAPHQSKMLLNEVAQINLYHQASVVKDYSNHDRVLMAHLR